MENKYNIDDIEDFLNQEMDATELAAFEKEMATNKELAAEVDFHEDVIKGIQGAAPMDFRKMVTNVHQEMKGEDFFSEIAETTEKVETTEAPSKLRSIFRRTSRMQGLAIAASFAALIGFSLWILNQPPNPEQLFADNFAVHQDVLSVEIADRLAETGFGTNKEALATLQSGIDTYKSGDYQSAIDQFNAFETAAAEDALTPYAQFYEAVALLKTGQGEAAQSELLNIVDKANFPLQNEAKWYLALTYLQQHKVNEAKAILENLTTVESYKQKALKLLNTL